MGNIYRVARSFVTEHPSVASLALEKEKSMKRYTFAVFALAAVSLFAGAPPADPKPADPPVTFRSNVSLARVDAQVVDSENRAITGLRVEDFILREDGKQVEICNFLNEK